MNIKNILKKRVVILDGATGTQLQAQGMPAGVCPEKWCLKNPKALIKVHSDYIASGSDVIYSCTFGANRIKLGSYGIKEVRKVNKQLALLAREAAPKSLVAGDIGPTGKFIEPFGSLKFQEAVDIFKEQVQGLLEGGVDLFAIETMMDIQEARAALIAVKEVTDKFSLVTMTFELGGRTLNGTDPLTALITLQSLGADAVGCNCSLGPQSMLELIETMRPYAKVPLAAKPNAGMPKLVKGVTSFGMKPNEFACFSKKFVSSGVGFLGGCCGTTPEHIKQVKKKISHFKSKSPARISISSVSSARKTVILEGENKFYTIGERINPTGKKDFSEQLRKGKTSIVRQLANQQQISGADILDVNVGAAGVDEKKVLRDTINFLSAVSSLPLVIDSSNPEAIERALRVYPGRALINSISGEKQNLKKLLPIAAKYGAMFIALPLGGKKLPLKFQERKNITLDILKEAKKYGFSRDDIIVDGLALAISSNPKSALETIKMISWCANTLKCNTVLGLSNISFGMPKRNLINAAFLSLAKANGLSIAIVNPIDKQVMKTKKAKNAAGQKDKGIGSFFRKVDKICSSLKKSSKVSAKTRLKDILPEQKVSRAILDGNREVIKNVIKEALKSKISAPNLVQTIMIPAIEKVGDLFDKKEYFLPQLIASAETMKKGFEYLEPFLGKDNLKTSKENVIILATVKGDIHDIGKNIVGLMLKNYGFSVIDLGKDVSAKKIINKIKKHKSCVVGLSALMTTTMVNMKEVIDMAKKEKLNCRFIVGGAVLTKSYAQSIGAKYANNGVEAVKLAKKSIK